MARVNELQRAALSPLRLVFIIAFLLTLTGGLGYLVIMPLKQLYWGVYGRLRPMVSEHDLLRQGKEIPAAALRDMVEGEQGTRQSGSTGAEANAAGAVTQEPVEPAKPAAEQQMQQPADKGGGETVKASKHALTKELVSKVAKDRTVVVTWANFHYREFVMNWVEHLNATGCTAYIVGAMDDSLLEFLVEKHIPTFSMSSGLTLGDFGWGTPTFHKMGREKINLLHTFTRMGFDVLISDVDTVWLRDPVPYMKQYPEADILTSSDHLLNTVSDEGLEKWPDAGSAANIGIMLFRPKAAELAEEWVNMLEKDANVWDQNAFNDLFRRGSQPLPDRTDRLFQCYDGKLKCGILPVSIFCSGHTGFTQGMFEKLSLKPYVVHATFQFSGTPGKRHRMRERLWWNDPPDYFSHPQGFIAWDDAVPAPLLEGVKNVQRNFTLEATMPHFNLVNHQIRQMRAAFALATITGRAVILPHLVCGMDRWWAPHDGTIPGSGLELPYACPADHVLDLEAMSNKWPDAEYGPPIPFREFSFLENPRAAALKVSVTNMEVCQDAASCGEGKLAPGQGEESLRAALTQGTAPQAKVLRFVGGIERLWGGTWASPEAAARFKRRLDTYGAIWCCVNAHPGHVWYDFFHDVPSHKDRHGREIEAPWKPLTGP